MGVVFLRVSAWALLAIITALSLVPPAFRPVTAMPHTIEHVAIFFLAGIIFTLAYRVRLIFLLAAAIIFAGCLEVLQIFVPGRHARLTDAAVDAIGICFGIMIASETFRMTMIRFLREMVRVMVGLPLPARIAVGLIIPVIFVIVTQWERLTFKQPTVLEPPKVLVTPQQQAQRSNNIPAPPSTDNSQVMIADGDFAKRLTRFVIVDPNVQGNGLISGMGQKLYLYGIKQIDSKKVCTRASGERWACGLHAYATLRNSISKKTITCDPKTLLPNAVNATCRIGATDIALTLVRDGLAELDDNIDDAQLVDAQNFAKRGKLGIWDR